MPLKVRKKRKKKHNPKKVGTTFELDVTSKLEELGFIVVRSANSATCIDLVATPDTVWSQFTLFIQCKVSNSLNIPFSSILKKQDVITLINLPVAKLPDSMIKCMVMISQLGKIYQFYWSEKEKRWVQIWLIK